MLTSFSQTPSVPAGLGELFPLLLRWRGEGLTGQDSRRGAELQCGPASVLRPPLQPQPRSSGLSTHCWSGECGGERGDKQKEEAEGGDEAKGRWPGRVTGEGQI